MFKEGVQFNANKLQAGGGSGLGLWITQGYFELFDRIQNCNFNK
jgi:hypothetical protein